LPGRKIESVFNQPWDLIAKSADLTDSVAQSAALFWAKNENKLALLGKIRIYFKENPQDWPPTELASFFGHKTRASLAKKGSWA
jgi:hypothetical protein